METYPVSMPEWRIENLLIPLFYVSKGLSIKAQYRVDKLKLHHDRIAAWQTFARSFVAIATVGLLWLVTQWQALAYLTLGLSVMIALFASLDYPARFMKHLHGTIFRGTCRVDLYLVSMAICILIMANDLIHCARHHQWDFCFCPQKLILIAFDYIMVSLILLQPSYPFTLSFPESLSNAIAIICGPLVAMGAFIGFTQQIRRNVTKTLFYSVNNNLSWVCIRLFQDKNHQHHR